MKGNDTYVYIYIYLFIYLLIFMLDVHIYSDSLEGAGKASCGSDTTRLGWQQLDLT
jgi:hypothetical protein